MKGRVKAMRVDYIDPFVESASEVLREILDVEVEKGSFTLERGALPKEGFAVSFGLVGDVEGTVLFDFSEKTAMKIAGRMNEGEFDTVQPLVMDSMAELANIIIGRSVTLLNNRGFDFRLTPPSMYWGKELKFCSFNMESLVIPVVTAYGNLTVSVALRAIV